MIPKINVLTTPLEETTHPTRTYKINVEHKRVDNYTDAIEAVIQSMYLIFNTERYEYPIYSWDYGFECKDLFGQPMYYVISEMPRRITEAAMYDDRVIGVQDFTFKEKGESLTVTCRVVTIYGQFDWKVEVTV